MEIYCIKNTTYSIRKRMNQVLKYGLTIAAALLLTSILHAQSDTISLKLTDVTIETAINEIRNQTDVSFIFNDEELSRAPKISVSVDEVTVEVALAKILKNTGLTFEKVNNTIVIKPLNEATTKPLLNPNTLKQTVRGQVFDKDSKATLPFATVHILNTDPAVGTTTDIEGNFSIDNIPVGRYTIKVSFVGYADTYIPEILLGSAKEAVVRVELSEQVESLGGITIVGAKGEPVNEMATVSAKAFNAEETKRYAATIGDPAR
ncbi:MAG: carboxypeptidase-like regulatory domain-containing protein, partial [Cyclobacteriaceae bacterium]|nr:carboxypeptidase-like regulatory domain-containing protein [Cyclobacteriaceae bacterium]